MPEDVVKEMLRQAEIRHEAIFRAALGMDQRASILAGGFAAAAGAVAAASLALGPQTGLRLPALIAAGFLAIAAGFCAVACRPQGFRFPGNPPNDWAKDPAYLLDNTLNEILLAHVARLQDWMHTNEQRQQQNARYLNWGLFYAAVGPVVAVVSALIVH